MEIIEENQGIFLKEIELFHLEDTLDCGQCFRFNEIEKNIWKGVVKEKTIVLEEKENGILFYDTDKEVFNDFWKDYFDLDRDYKKIQNEFLEHKELRKAAKYAPGIRILKQDGFEVLISFIISQNNNIKRIKGIVERLCENFGKKLPSGEYAFPSVETIASLTKKDLEILRAGWRWEYILDGAKKVESGEVNLEEIRKEPIEEARKSLQKIKGVGPKVAECVLLYGLNRLEAFPLDVWMKRAMNTVFLADNPEDFGRYAGIAQQYIFHYARNNPEEFKK